MGRADSWRPRGGRFLLPVTILLGLTAGWTGESLFNDPPVTAAKPPPGITALLPATREASQPAEPAASPVSAARADLEERLIDASLPDVTGMLTDATSRLNPLERLDDLSVIYRRYAELDPQAALSHAFTQGAALESAWSTRWIHDIFYVWARDDLGAAIAAAARLQDMQRQAVQGILSAIPESNREGRSSVTDALHLEWDTSWAAPEQMLAIARDPEAAFRRSEGSRSSLGVRQAAARAWAAAEPRAAADAAAQEFEGFRDAPTLRGVMSVWSRADVDDAAGWVDALAPPIRSTEVIAAAVGGIAAANPSRAVATAERLHDREEREAATNSAFWHWSRSDPRAAANRLAAIADPHLRPGAVRALGRGYSRADPRAAHRWAVRLSPDEAAMVLPLILIEMARSGSPEQASRLIRDIEIPIARHNAASRIAEEWARQSPAAALDWCLSFDEPAQRGRMVQGVFSTWAYRDSESALQRLKRLEGPDRRSAADALLRSSNISVLEELYATIDDPAIRAKAARRLAISLSGTDQERASYYRSEAARLTGTHP